MKIIIEQYGGTIMSSIIVVAILGLLLTITDQNGNVGIYEIIAAHADMDNSLYENMTDTNAVIQENSAIVVPTVTYTGNANMKAQTACKFGDYFSVRIAGKEYYKLSDMYTSQATKVFTYEVLNIVNESGTVYTGLHNNQTGEIIFSQGGAYEATIRCRDLINGKEATIVIAFPVDN